ncbi:MAG: hypothetical protein ACYTFO_10805 [Planctomycetota bacterium]|jgi:hypothetical protein
MTKRDIIDQIIESNPGARPEFLADFDPAELRLYLSKLNILKQPRQPLKSSWAARQESEPKLESRPDESKQTIEVPSPCPAASPPRETGRMGLYRPAEPKPLRPTEPPQPAEPQQPVESRAEIIDFAEHLQPVQVPAPVAVAAEPDRKSEDTIDDENWLF